MAQLQLNGNEGRVIRDGPAPNVAANPKYKNFIWIKEGNPPTVQLYNVHTNAWSSGDGEILTKLDPPAFTPEDGTNTDGFSIAHSDGSVTIWYSVNGEVFLPYPGGTILLGSRDKDYFYVSAYAVKSGSLDSDIVMVEYLAG